jgi:hypothetical protein
MPKPPRLSLKSIVAATASPGLQDTKVVPFRSGPEKPAANARGTLKERSKQLSVYLDPAVYDQLRDIAYAERTKIHPLMLEALDLLFGNRGARSIQDLEESAHKNAP